MKSLSSARNPFEGLPEVAGAKTKTFEFKLRIVFPWDRHSEGLLAARTGSVEQLTFMRSLVKSLQVVESTKTPITVVDLTSSERRSRFFKSPGDPPGMTALLSLTLSYSAHRIYPGAQLRELLKIRVNHERYSNDSVQATVLPNS